MKRPQHVMAVKELWYLLCRPLDCCWRQETLDLNVLGSFWPGDTKKDGTVANNMVIMLHCVSRRKSCSYDRSRILQTTIFIVFQNVVRIRPQDQSTSTTCWVKRKEIQECRPLGTRHLLFPSSFSPHVGRYDTAFIVFYLPSVSLAVERATLR